MENTHTQAASALFLLLLYLCISCIGNVSLDAAPDPNAREARTGRDKVSLYRQSSHEIIVPKDYPTIQEAINNVSQNGTILVYPGAYNENLKIYRSLTLKSYGGIAVLIADPEVGLLMENAGSVVLEGFEIRPRIRTGADSIGILAEGKTQAIVRFNRLIDWAKSVYIRAGASTVMEANTVETNSYAESVDGMVIEAASGLIISNRFFIKSTSDYISGLTTRDSRGLVVSKNEVYILEKVRDVAVGLDFINSEGDVSENRIFVKRATGVSIQGSQGIVLKQNYISGIDSVGINLLWPSNEWDRALVKIIENTVSGDSQSNSIGIVIQGLEAVLQNNIVTGNSRGVYFSFGSQGQLQNNLITANGDGVLINRDTIAWKLDNNQIIKNRVCGVRVEEQLPGRDAVPNIEGQGNWITGNTNGELCPINFPWPPGFVKP